MAGRIGFAEFLVFVTGVSALIWLAAFFVMARDRSKKAAMPVSPANDDLTFAPSSPSSPWRGLLGALIAIFLFPIYVTMLTLLAPFAVVIWAVYGFFRLREVVFGVPIPDFWPDRDAPSAA